jgi:hypothetical protein
MGLHRAGTAAAAGWGPRPRANTCWKVDFPSGGGSCCHMPQNGTPDEKRPARRIARVQRARAAAEREMARRGRRRARGRSVVSPDRRSRGPHAHAGPGDAQRREEVMAAAKMERTRYPGISKRGSRYVVVWRHRRQQHRRSSGCSPRPARRRASATASTASRRRAAFDDYAREWVDGYAGPHAGRLLEQSRAAYRRRAGAVRDPVLRGAERVTGERLAAVPRDRCPAHDDVIVSAGSAGCIMAHRLGRFAQSLTPSCG